MRGKGKAGKTNTLEAGGRAICGDVAQIRHSTFVVALTSKIHTYTYNMDRF